MTTPGPSSRGGDALERGRPGGGRAADDPAAASRPWRVAIIDDSPDDRAEVRRLLLRGSGRRYAWIEAETGAVAVRAVLDPGVGPPDCALLDFHLPDMDAPEVLQALAGPDGVAACPVVVLTGSEGPEHGRALLRAGAQDYLGKGWMTAESLTRAVENAAERWEMVRELHAKEVAVRAGEELLRISLRAARAGAWSWEVPTGAITWSPENSHLYGVDPDALPPTYQTWRERIYPDDRDRAEADARDALEGRGPELRSEFRIIHPTDGVRWLLALGRLESGPDGRPARMIGINLDITDRKQFEQALAEQDRRKDEFLATLAHELRNPLAPIRTGLAVMKLAPPDDPVVAQTREMIGRQVTHMVRLVDDLLDVSRIGSGKVELKRERVPIEAVLENAVESSRPLIEAAGHELSIRRPDRPVWLEGDLTRLAQVVGNVLNNAAKYTPEGGRIELAASVEGDAAVVRVRDDGAGITEDMLPKVFGLFTQVDRTLNRSQGGLGIGLSLVKKLVELHGGTIEAESPGLGLGSTFTIRLPVAPAPEPRAAPESPGVAAGGAPSRSTLRVLLVDDSTDGAQSLARLLRIWGHQTRVIHDGPGAIEAAADFLPELVLLDIGLPGMDGYEVCRRLRADPKLSGTTLVALTGWGTEDDKRRAREAGFDHHLVKPIDPDQIERVLREVGDDRERAAGARG